MASFQPRIPGSPAASEATSPLLAGSAQCSLQPTSAPCPWQVSSLNTQTVYALRCRDHSTRDHLVFAIQLPMIHCITIAAPMDFFLIYFSLNALLRGNSETNCPRDHPHQREKDNELPQFTEAAAAAAAGPPGLHSTSLCPPVQPPTPRDPKSPQNTPSEGAPHCALGPRGLSLGESASLALEPPPGSGGGPFWLGEPLLWIPEHASLHPGPQFPRL